MIRSYKGIFPKIPDTCYVDESAQIIGDVTLGEHSSVWMNSVIRGDVHYIRIGAFDSEKGWESLRLSFIAQRPAVEPGFQVVRSNGPGRQINYTTRSYATDQPPEQRYRDV